MLAIPNKLELRGNRHSQSLTGLGKKRGSFLLAGGVSPKTDLKRTLRMMAATGPNKRCAVALKIKGMVPFLLELFAYYISHSCLVFIATRTK